MRKNSPALAKLSRPRLHGAVARERLFDLLDGARRCAAICVVGPPGAGKTTLVASWLDARGIRGIWYQVDPGDADLATFFYYLGQAAHFFSRKGQRALPALTPEYLHDIEGFARRFFRELFSRLPVPSTLVLDNYQEVDPENPFHQIVSTAVNELPEGQTLIAVSRRDPPAHYARLVANESVRLVDWEELRLTLDEATTIAAQRGCNDAELVRVIHARTDGWAAGLTLMLERDRDIEAPSRILPEAHQAIFDYFAAQIFARVTDETRHVLMATAWLPSFSMAQAEAMTGNDSVQSILDDLYRRHLFVHRRPGEPPTYQYHALFRHFLRAQAQRVMNAQSLQALSIRGAGLLEHPATVESAVELYCEAREWSKAMRAIVSHAPDLLAHGRWRTLQELAARLPRDEMEDALWLRYCLGRSKLGPAPSEARNEMLRVLRGFEAKRDVVGQILCASGIIESHWVEWSGFEDVDPWIDDALRLLTDEPRFPDVDTELRVMSTLMMAILMRQPRNPALAGVQERVATLMKSDIADDAKLLAGSVLLAQTLLDHDLRLSTRVVNELRPLTQRSSVSAVAGLMWFPRLACHYAHRAEYELARQTLEQTERLLAEEGLRFGLAGLCYLGGYVSVVSGDLERADGFATLLDTSSKSHWLFHRGVVHHIRCMTALARGEVAAALEQGHRAAAIAKAVGMAWPRVWFPLPTIYAMLDVGDYAQAEAYISEMRGFIAGTYLKPFEVDLLLAEAYLALKTASPEFHRLLATALAQAQERDYIFPCRAAFAAHRVLFAEAFRVGIARDYLRRTIRRFKIQPGQEAGDSWPWPIKVYALGRFDIFVDDQPLNFGRKAPRKPIALLKGLIAFGGRSVPEVTLLDAIWPGEEGDAAHVDCKAALQRLRKLLGSADAVTVADGRISLEAGQVWVDAFEFEREADDGADVARISALYRGHLLPEEREAPWVLAPRERLRNKFIRHVARGAHTLEKAQQLEAAASLYQRGIDADDLAEEFYQGLMRCHIGRGRHADAMAVYRRLRQMLSVTLGISPSRDSNALFRSLQT